MCRLMNNMDRTTVILLSISIILFCGFLMTRLTKKISLPNVTGYILAGIIIGPYVLNLVPQEIISDMSFVSDIALAFIAFGVGRFFEKEILKQAGVKIIIITALEALLAGFLVTITMYFIFHLALDFSLLLGAIATATAPASTMMTINQYKAKGIFVNTLLQVVAFDDVVCLMVFSVVAAIISANADGGVSFIDVALPILYNLGAILLGLVCGLSLSRLLSEKRSEDNRLILTIAMLLAIAGICSVVQISPLLPCMVFGTVYINVKRDNELFEQVNKFTPPILSLFFVVSGMNLNLSALKSFGIIGIVYFLVRIIGKYLGAYIGCAIGKMPINVKNYLGLALIPQAGVAIGLAFLGQRLLPKELGDVLLLIILSSSVLYELVGPACAKIALVRSGAIDKKNLNPTTKRQKNNPRISSSKEYTQG